VQVVVQLMVQVMVVTELAQVAQVVTKLAH
jgi:hypothetical protein